MAFNAKVKQSAWFHDVKKEQADELLATMNNASGSFLVRPHKDPSKFVLSVSFKGKATHHLGQIADGNVTVNGSVVEDVTNIVEVVEKFSQETSKNWPVKLTDSPPKSAGSTPPVDEIPPPVTPRSSISISITKGLDGYGMTIVNNGHGNFATKVAPGKPAEEALNAAGLSLDDGYRFKSINGQDVWDSPKKACTGIMKESTSVDVVLVKDKPNFEATLAAKAASKLESPEKSMQETPNTNSGIYDTVQPVPEGTGNSSIAPATDTSSNLHVGNPLWLHPNNPPRATVVDLLQRNGMSEGLFLVRQKAEDTYCLDMAVNGKSSHHLIKRHPETNQPCVSGEKELSAPTVNELLRFLLSAPEEIWPCRPTMFIPVNGGSVTSLADYVASEAPPAYSDPGPEAEPVMEAESRPAEGVITDITELPESTPGRIPRPNPERDQQHSGIRKATPAEIAAAGAGLSSPGSPGVKMRKAKSVPPAVEAARKALHKSVQVLSAVRQDRLHEAVAKYINRKFELVDLVVALDEILLNVEKEPREEVEEALFDLMPKSKRAEYSELLRRAKMETAMRTAVEKTPLEIQAALAKVVAETLQRLRGDTRRQDQISSFERRVQLASVQRGFGHLSVQAQDPNQPFDIEQVAKHVHVGWARAVATSWAPEYGLEPLGEPAVDKYGALDSFNFSTVQGYQIYLQRLALGRQRYLIPGEEESSDVPMVPDTQKHFYRVAAEMLLDSYIRMHPNEANREVKRLDSFAYVELKQLGVIRPPQSNIGFASPSRSLGSPIPFDLSGRGGSTRTSAMNMSFGSLNESPDVSGAEVDQPPWFHGMIDKSTAAEMLQGEANGTFIVRQRPGNSDFALDFKFEDRVTHHLVNISGIDGIVRVNGKILVEGTRTLQDLIGALYQPHSEWPAKLTSFIPRFGVSASRILEAQLKLSRSKPVTVAKSIPKSGGDEEDVDWNNSVGTVQTTKSFLVELIKGESGLGMSIVGKSNEDDQREGVFISKITEGSTAEKCGKLAVGMRILSIGSASMTEATKKEAVAKLKVKQGTTIDLKVRDDRAAWKAFQRDTAATKDVENESSKPDVYGIPQPLTRRTSEQAIESSSFPEDIDNVEGSNFDTENTPVPEPEIGKDESADGIKKYFVTYASGKKTGMTVANDGAGNYVSKFKEDGAFDKSIKSQGYPTAELVDKGLRLVVVDDIDVRDELRSRCMEILKAGTNITVVYEEDMEIVSMATAASNVVGIPVSVPIVNDDVPPIASTSKDIQVNSTMSPSAKNGLSADNVGDRVTVKGYEECSGTLRFFGPHAESGATRCGVELDLPIGKNNGTVKGHKYFECAAKCGCLVAPSKVTILSGDVSAPVPQAALVDDSLQVSIAKPAKGGFGMTLGAAGSKTFVTKVKTGGAAESVLATKGLRVDDGLQFMSLNGSDVSSEGKAGILTIMKGSKNVDIVFAKDPYGFSKVELSKKESQKEAQSAAPTPQALTVTINKPASGGFGMSIGEGDGGVFVTKVKSGGAAEYAFDTSGLSVSDGLQIMSINGTSVTGSSKSDVVSLMKGSDRVEITFQINQTGLGAVKKSKSSSSLASPPTSPPAVSTNPFEVPIAESHTPTASSSVFDGMGRLALIKHLRSVGVDYSNAKNVDELRELAIQSSGSAPTEANANEAVGSALAAPVSEYDNMGKLALIKILRSKNIDYKGKGVEELRELVKTNA